MKKNADEYMSTLVNGTEEGVFTYLHTFKRFLTCGS